MNFWLGLLLTLYAITQIGYFYALVINHWYYTLPVDKVEPAGRLPAHLPPIMLLYPVLRERESTMRTTMTAVAALDYPTTHYRVVAIPNVDDTETIVSLQRLQQEFPFLEIMTIPPTSSPTWNVVWANWQRNPKAYWWHRGERAGVRDLPPKKTRQLIYAFYNLFNVSNGDDWLLSYVDADSAPPADLFRLAAIGSPDYEVLQATNVTGNLMTTTASSLHAMDHLSWDASMWQHQSADGRQPFWVLGKGVFFRAADLLELGGFHPWLTIEGPEVGMRMWTNGRRLGVLRSPLMEEVADTFGMGISQRKRWVAGVLQSLHTPLHDMGMTGFERFRARLNFVPCLSLLLNVLGLPLGILVVALLLTGHDLSMARWLIDLSGVNLGLALIALVRLYVVAPQRSRPALPLAPGAVPAADQPGLPAGVLVAVGGAPGHRLLDLPARRRSGLGTDREERPQPPTRARRTPAGSAAAPTGPARQRPRPPRRRVVPARQLREVTSSHLTGRHLVGP